AAAPPLAAVVERRQPRQRRGLPTRARAASSGRGRRGDFFFETGGMIRRILNADAIASIEVLVHGRDPALRRELVLQLEARLARLSGIKDTYMPQGMELPQYRVEVDRTAAQLLGITETDAVRNVIVTLMSSAQLAPNSWIDPKSGNPYFVGVQYPEHRV